MDWSGFGSMVPGGANGGLLAALQKMQIGGGAPAAAPAVPADGSMQPTIGPGAAAPAAPQAPTKFGMPQGGLLGLLQGKSPQGLMGLLQRGMQPGAAPMAGMPQAGMMGGGLPGMPGSPMAGPVAPPQTPQLPTDINPMNQF